MENMRTSYLNTYTNSKSQAPNNKQIIITEIQNPKQYNFILEHLNFEYCSPCEI